MSAHLSHHYVPKCYLRNFSERIDGKTVCLFNLKSAKIIENAPTKSQCAKNLLYGTDDLENVLGEIEGKYAEWITRGVLAKPPVLIEGIEEFCRFFLLIQYMRTEGHAARMRAHLVLADQLADMPEDSDYSITNLDTSDSAMARDGIRFALELKDSVADLKFALLINQSHSNFITCDDPVVMTNRLYIQKVGDSNFGSASAGAVFYFPISPRIAILLYDGDMHMPTKKNGCWVAVKSKRDVNAFNHLIYLKAKENVYGQSASDFSALDHHENSVRRIDNWQRGRILTEIDSDSHGRRFREASERPKEGGYVIMTSQQHPHPKFWPSTLKFRNQPTAYGNGSGMGYVRKGTVPLYTYGIRKIKL